MNYSVITGASKGIGKAIAFELAKSKQNLLLIARSAAELEALCVELHEKFNIEARFLAIDLSAPDAAQKVYQFTIENQLSVDTLINNAGYAVWGHFESNDLEEQNKMLQLNMLTIVNLTYYFIPILKKQKQSYILNIASIAAYLPVPSLILYAASKSFVLSFSRGLNYELKDSPISVTCISPGPVDTNFVNRAGMQAIANTAAKFEISPERLAKKALKAMYSKKIEYVPGFTNKLGVLLSLFIPKRLIEKVIASAYKK
jgi:uncharacterized protein